jgi:Rieske Fe-S protein
LRAGAFDIFLSWLDSRAGGAFNKLHPETMLLLEKGGIIYKQLQEMLKNTLMFPLHFVKGRLKKTTGNINGLAPIQGMVIDQEGTKIAVFKAADGTVTRLSAVCTHLGCVVNWDDVQKKWVCPCHGATYSPQGVVEKGPATRNLSPKAE